MGGGDVEEGETRAPLIGTSAEGRRSGGGSIWMVYLSTAVAVCGSFEFGTCIGYSSPSQSGIINELGLSLAEYSLFGSLLNIGAMIGAISSGRLADFSGRKGAMRSSAIICILGWLAIYMAKGPVLLDFGRLLTGYGTGVLSYVVPVFISEIAPKNLRGMLTTINQLMICTGISIAYAVGTQVDWHMLVITCSIPCFVLLVGLFIIPESPRWLAKVGYKREFEAALTSLRSADANIYEEAAEIEEYILTLESLPKASIFDLFQARYCRSVIIGVGLMVFQQFGGVNGIGFYSSDTFVAAGFSSGTLGTILMGVIQIPVCLLCALLMDRTGRRPLLLVSASGTFVCSFLAGLSFYFKGQGIYLDWVPVLALIGMVGFLGTFSFGMGAIPWVIMSEIFPINIKGIAGSLVTLINWFGSWIVSYTFNFLMSWSSPGTFFIYAAVYAGSVLFIAKVVPETKGRTLEEIQASINPTKRLLAHSK